MTEVAQVETIDVHDMEDVQNENNESAEENKEDAMTHEENDAAVSNIEMTSEETLKTEVTKSCQMSDTTRDDAESRPMNGVEHEENGIQSEKDDISEAVNGVTQKKEENEDPPTETSDLQDISDVALKKEVSDNVILLHRNKQTNKKNVDHLLF